MVSQKNVITHMFVETSTDLCDFGNNQKVIK